jgi:hypothetical protein
MPKGTTAYFDAIGKFRLLGLVHGHWDINEKELNNSDIVPVDKHGVNVGIGIVVPAVKILETIHRQELVEMRNAGDEDLARKTKTTTMDSIKRKSSPPTGTFTKADFEAALKKASSKLSDQK